MLVTEKKTMEFHRLFVFIGYKFNELALSPSQQMFVRDVCFMLTSQVASLSPIKLNVSRFGLYMLSDSYRSMELSTACTIFLG